MSRPRCLNVAGRVLLALASALASSGCGAGDGSRTVLRVGYQKAGTLNLLRLRHGLEPDLALLGVRVEWVGFPAGPQLLEALSAGSIDYGHTGDAPPIMAQVAGVPFVYVACEQPRPHAEAILVPSHSPVHKVADLIGRRVALNKGSNVHYLLVRALDSAGLRYDQVRTVFLPPSDARAAFAGGSVDAWVAWDPYFAEAETAGGARVLTDGEGLVANREFHLAASDYARPRPDVIQAIRAAVGREGDWAKANPGEVVRLLAAELGLGSETLERMIGRKVYGIAPMDEAVVAEQQRVADAFAAIGLIPAKIVVRNAVPDLAKIVAGASHAAAAGSQRE